MFVFIVPYSIVITCLENTDLLALLCVRFCCVCHFPIRCLRSGVLFDCIEFRSLPALLFSYTELYMYVQRITYADAVHQVTSWSNG